MLNDIKKDLFLIGNMNCSTANIGLFSALSSMAQDFGGLLDVGTVAPDLVNEKGNVLSLEKYRGRCVVLHFWATWSPNCKIDMAKMKELYATYDIQGVEFIGVSYDTEQETLKKYLKNESIHWRNICEFKEWKETNTAKDYRLSKIPTMYLLDTEGKVLLATVETDKLKGKLDELQKNHKLVIPSLAGQDHLPQFTGGTPVLIKFLSSNLKYPKIAARYHIEGKIIVNFIVEKDGKVNIENTRMINVKDQFHLPKYGSLRKDEVRRSDVNICCPLLLKSHKTNIYGQAYNKVFHCRHYSIFRNSNGLLLLGFPRFRICIDTRCRYVGRRLCGGAHSEERKKIIKSEIENEEYIYHSSSPDRHFSYPL